MGSRLELGQAKKILDVGCGIGHWGQIIAPLLSVDAELIGVDREATWIAKATERAMAQGLGNRYSYQEADATQLHFRNDTFDLVTCQTKEWSKHKFIGWDRDEVFGYFVAGGGQKDEFEYYWNLLYKDAQNIVKAIENSTYHSAGGCVTYLISARKPLRPPSSKN